MKKEYENDSKILVFLDRGVMDLFTTYKFLELCPNGKSIAFEPDPTSFQNCKSVLVEDEIII